MKHVHVTIYFILLEMKRGHKYKSQVFPPNDRIYINRVEFCTGNYLRMRSNHTSD